ncbi:MAG: formylglycine-generating enzyme family protein, partial [Planctomycetales bacterium]|nr:formylglycine-generating enzyme family protein [Planctomycetales bacterium]
EIDGGYMVPYTVTIPNSKVSFEMLPIPGGETLIGSPDDEENRLDDEGTQFKVMIEPFWMAKCEVTWAEYKEFMKTYNIFKEFQAAEMRIVNESNVADTITSPTPLYEPDTTFALGAEDDQPAVTMSQYAAKQYTKWIGAITGTVCRLPSECEWEHACRAGTSTPFSFDDADQIDEYAWHYGNSDDAYHAVGQKKPNAWGLHDMHGNVAELCLDQYYEDTYSKFGGKTVNAWDAIQWTKTMFPHVIRGGGWDCDAEQLRSAARRSTEDWRDSDPNVPKSPWWFTDEPSQAVGFRIIRPLKVPTKEQQQQVYRIDSDKLQMAVEFRLEEGRGIRALVDKDLPAAIEELKNRK